MITMILNTQINFVRGGVAPETFSYPPVLVPPIKSKYSQGRGVSSSPFKSRIHSMRFCSINKVDIPRIPPPSASSFSKCSQISFHYYMYAPSDRIRLPLRDVPSRGRDEVAILVFGVGVDCRTISVVENLPAGVFESCLDLIVLVSPSHIHLSPDSDFCLFNSLPPAPSVRGNCSLVWFELRSAYSLVQHVVQMF